MQLTIKTAKKQELIDITSKVEEIVKKSEIKEGLCNAYIQHTTAAILVNENEERLIDDINHFFEEFIPSNKHYKHDDIKERNCPPDEKKNAPAHLKAMLIGPSKFIPIKNGKLNLGVWQSVMLAEFDGPRNRNIIITIIKQ